MISDLGGVSATRQVAGAECSVRIGAVSLAAKTSALNVSRSILVRSRSMILGRGLANAPIAVGGLSATGVAALAIQRSVRSVLLPTRAAKVTVTFSGYWGSYAPPRHGAQASVEIADAS